MAHKPELAPAFTFARRGYDVWLGNNRGNNFARRHVKLDPVDDEEEFFTYDFEDLGEYDVPAQIDYALAKSKQEKLTFMGYSQGNT